METLEQIPFEEPAVNSFVLARNPSSPNEYMPQIKSCSLESLSFLKSDINASKSFNRTAVNREKQKARDNSRTAVDQRKPANT